MSDRQPIDVPIESKHLLCRAYRHRDWRDMYFIDRALGHKAYASNGANGRKFIRDLYREGLVVEWNSPWSPPLLLTDKGNLARKTFRKELGYDD